MKLRVAIIDDEKHAIETLVYDLNEGFESSIDIVFTSTSPVEGVKRIMSENLDLLFLDIEMPGLSGIDILNLIGHLNINVVITTAHQEFAMQAVGTNAIAYLLKPIQAESLDSLIKQVLESKQIPGKNHVIKNKIPVPDIKGIELIPHDEIIYCKSDGNYCKLFLNENRKLTVSKALKYFSNNLPANQFVRIHKSYLVNLNYVRKYLKIGGGELVMTNNDILPVSRNYRAELLKLLQNGS